MARKGEDLLKDLDDLGIEDQQSSSSPQAPAASHKKSASSKSTPKASTTKSKDENDENLFGDIEKQLASKPQQSSSRPATPRVSSSSTSAATSQPAKHTPASSNPSARTSEEKGRDEAQTRSNRESAEGVKSEGAATVAGGGGGGGGGWWGVFSGAATAARKQAESLAKTVQANEEAQRWAAQVQGRLGGLQHLGMSCPIPAPPIGSSRNMELYAD